MDTNEARKLVGELSILILQQEKRIEFLQEEILKLEKKIEKIKKGLNPPDGPFDEISRPPLSSN